MGQEEAKVKQIIKDMATGTDIGHKLVYDPVSKTIKPVKNDKDPDETREITPEDATLG